MQSFNQYFDQNLQKKRIAALKKGKIKYKKTPYQRMQRSSSTYYDPGIYNQASVIDTAHASSQTFTSKG
jgi:malic enzyme